VHVLQEVLGPLNTLPDAMCSEAGVVNPTEEETGELEEQFTIVCSGGPQKKFRMAFGVAMSRAVQHAVRLRMGTCSCTHTCFTCMRHEFGFV
jgi:hypothetical protein